jgi:tRNA-splicing ligase RtcB
MSGKIRMSLNQIDDMLINGSEYMLNLGYGIATDLEFIEEQGKIKNANPKKISDKAKKRQIKQIGTLGSGNHYLEIDIVEKIIDEKATNAYGLFEKQAIVSIHCGSRGLGHQIGSDYLKILENASKKYKIPIRERELVAAPIKSPEGQDYLQAVNCGINAAFANRQVIGHLARQTISEVMEIKEKDIKTMYEVGHNTCKIEQHNIKGNMKEVLVHRKGSTRAFGPGRKEIPEKYRDTGQPLFVGGTMGTASYILKGTGKSMEETFGSGIHGAGRLISRSQAKKRWWGEKLKKDLADKDILVKAHSMAGLAEEAPGAYKDIERVVDIMHNAGINKKVARIKPYIVIKG